MEIVYTEYAEESIADRNISKSIIENTLKNPEEVVEGKENRKIAHKVIGNKLLRVIFETNKKAYIIITAYYTQPLRYMKK